MHRKTAFVLVLTLVAGSALAGEPPRRAVVIRDGKVIGGNLLKRAFLGVSLLEVTPQFREHLGGPREAGVVVQSVTENSPAARAGMKVGDVITAIDGKTVDSAWDVTEIMSEKKKGDSVRVDFYRGKNKQTIVATADERDFESLFKGLEGLRGLQGLENLPRLKALDLADIEKNAREHGFPGTWRASVFEATKDCDDKIRSLEERLNELEKKLKD